MRAVTDTETPASFIDTGAVSLMTLPFSEGSGPNSTIAGSLVDVRVVLRALMSIPITLFGSNVCWAKPNHGFFYCQHSFLKNPPALACACAAHSADADTRTSPMHRATYPSPIRPIKKTARFKRFPRKRRRLLRVDQRSADNERRCGRILSPCCPAPEKKFAACCAYGAASVQMRKILRGRRRVPTRQTPCGAYRIEATTAKTMTPPSRRTTEASAHRSRCMSASSSLPGCGHRRERSNRIRRPPSSQKKTGRTWRPAHDHPLPGDQCSSCSSSSA